jgi:hypothetical protein
MCRTAIIIASSLFCVLNPPQTHPESQDKAAVPTIAVTELDVSDEVLTLRYEIRNESEQDIWILLGFEEYGATAELFMHEDKRTLLIRRRWDVPFNGGGNRIHGRYLVMRPGESQSESINCAVPVCPQYGFAVGQQPKVPGLVHATRLAIEIGYYTSDLPAMIRQVLEPTDTNGRKFNRDDDWKRRFYFGGSLYFNALSEVLRQRDEEILLPYTYQWFKGEQVLRTVVEDVRVPYEDLDKRQRARRRGALDIPACTRVEIKYRPSLLAGQRSLLNREEMQSLQSENTIVVRDGQDLDNFVSNINKHVPTNGIVRERTAAQVVCYNGDERRTSFAIYNSDSVVTGFSDRFTYNRGSLDGTLRAITPQITPFDLRIGCAANLRNLWNRFRLYYNASGTPEMLYPAPSEWCDALTRAYQRVDMLDRFIESPHKCLSAGEGKNHYAMNPNCRLDSPADMVLLFETKAGWNQYGGPELFTFDNHDPKGGCVLLNDGTVKFIRTDEELRRFRWK